MGEYDRAEVHLLGSLAILEETGDSYWQSIALINLGILNYHLGDYEQSTEYYLRALDIEERLGERGKAAGVLVNLGLIACESNDYTAALDYFSRGLAIFREIGDRYGEAIALKNGADVHIALGDYDRALAGHRECLRIALETGERYQQAGALDGLGRVYGELGEHEKAVKHLHRSLEIKEEIGDRQGFVESLLNLGSLLVRQGKMEEAFRYLRRALAIAGEIGSKPLLFKAHLSLGAACEQAGDAVEALAHYKEFYLLKSEVASEIAGTRMRHLQARLALEKLEKEAELNRLRAERMEHELELARKVQLSLLPNAAPGVPDLDIASLCLPALEAGGDYFDYFRLGERRLGIAIGDVTGKGMPAAIYMTLAKGILKSYATPDASPRDVLSRANRLVYETFSRGSFISMIYAVIDSERRTLTYACAGHNPLVHIRDGRRLVVEGSHGLALGLAGPEKFDGSITETTLRLEPGDTIVLYTDGFSEARNAAREEYGDTRLVETALHSSTLPTAAGVLDEIRSEVQSFTGATQQHDDMTIVVVRVGK
jgi:serine phosphatase RsbU (regulator of sigma subunit)/Flp pilus assembly protein TadD